jgi:hypothetical protein
MEFFRGRTGVLIMSAVVCPIWLKDSHATQFETEVDR